MYREQELAMKMLATSLIGVFTGTVGAIIGALAGLGANRKRELTTAGKIWVVAIWGGLTGFLFLILLKGLFLLSYP